MDRIIELEKELAELLALMKDRNLRGEKTYEDIVAEYDRSLQLKHELQGLETLGGGK